MPGILGELVEIFTYKNYVLKNMLNNLKQMTTREVMQMMRCYRCLFRTTLCVSYLCLYSHSLNLKIVSFSNLEFKLKSLPWFLQCSF